MVESSYEIYKGYKFDIYTVDDTIAVVLDEAKAGMQGNISKKIEYFEKLISKIKK